ncbi:hypothetical protein COCNU_09G002420 [Cocos nucifera]|uniref:Uncharacterized protein n=1 Tax=Cocos nucifera TaxID=13894 RepID=A0A8K0IK06_COCNU|nr:hypothetical protein COCNU_09G002420 [Cocos nucifera]
MKKVEGGQGMKAPEEDRRSAERDSAWWMLPAVAIEEIGIRGLCKCRIQEGRRSPTIQWRTDLHSSLTGG